MKKNSFPATVIIVILFFGAIFLLSGLCTGLFALEAEFGDGGAYAPSHWYEALFIGSFALLPSGLMLWAAIRQIRRGNNKISGIIFLIAGALMGLYGVVGLFGSFLRIPILLSSSMTGPARGYIVGNLLFIIVILFCSFWLLRVSIKILRNKFQDHMRPETFD